MNYPWILNAEANDQLAPIVTGPNVAVWVGTPWIDPEAHYLYGTTQVLGFGWNTGLLEGDPPSTWEDLLDPAYAGVIGFTEPASPVIADFCAFAEEQLGGEQGLRDLAALDPTFYASGVPLMQGLGAGEITVTGYASAQLRTDQAAGAPVEFFVPTPAWTSANLVYLPTWAKRPNAAQVLVDFIASPDGQEALSVNGASPLDGIESQLVDIDDVQVVAALDLDLETARATAGDLTGAIAIAVDVADSLSVDAAVAEVEAVLGPIDLLAHIAGVDAHRDIKRRLADHRAALAAGDGEAGFCGVVEMSDEEWHRVVRVNLDGTFYVVRAVLRTMIPRRRGAIVTTASTAALSGIVGAAHYSASKGDVRLLTQSVAREVAPFGIRVNAVAPGMTATPMFGRNPNNELLPKGTPIGRVAEAAEVASAFAYLLSDEASYIVGETMNVNGGLVIQ